MSLEYLTKLEMVGLYQIVRVSFEIALVFFATGCKYSSFAALVGTEQPRKVHTFDASRVSTTVCSHFLMLCCIHV